LADGGVGRGNILHYVKSKRNCPGRGNVRGICPRGIYSGGMSRSRSF